MLVPEILKRDCWSTNSTYKKFYDKDIINNNTDDCRYDSLLIDSESQ